MTDPGAPDKTAPRDEETNVLLEFRMQDPMSAEVLDRNSDDVLEAVEKHAADIALGPAIAINPNECAIKLRFDCVGRSKAQIYRQIAKVLSVLEKETDLHFLAVHSDVEDRAEPVETATGEFAAC
jgi:acyl-CoA synthetase (NDP forming)